MAELERRARTVSSAEGLADFTLALRDDFLANPNAWENPSPNDFLEAIHRWLDRKLFGLPFGRPEFWSQMALHIYEAKVIELPDTTGRPDRGTRWSGELVHGVDSVETFRNFLDFFTQDLRNHPRMWDDIPLERYLESLSARFRAASGSESWRHMAKLLLVPKHLSWGIGSRIGQHVSRIASPEAFAEFALELRKDFAFYADEWESETLPYYLGSMSGWLEDGDHLRDETPGLWRPIAHVLLAPFTGAFTLSPEIHRLADESATRRKLSAMVSALSRELASSPEFEPERSIEAYLVRMAAVVPEHGRNKPPRVWKELAGILYAGRIYE